MIKSLLPISWIYETATNIRNWMFDRGILSSTSFSTPIICVGNLSVGGTGKTPHTEWVVEKLLLNQKKVGILSRGYGRRSKGFRWVETNSDADNVGDEPLQMRKKLPTASVVCAVCERRVEGIQKMLQQHSDLDVVVLDDAYQHRYVKANIYILLTDYHLPYYADAVLPAGRLREKAKGAERADIIIVTKCPSTLSDTERDEISRKLHPLSHQQVFFSSIGYAALPTIDKALLVTGIANAKPLLQHLNSINIAFEHLKFSDHHRFSENDCQHIIQQSAQYPTLLTTEKDWQRLADLQLPEKVWQKVIPIKITPHFLFKQEEDLINTLYNYVSKNQANG